MPRHARSAAGNRPIYRSQAQYERAPRSYAERQAAARQPAVHWGGPPTLAVDPEPRWCDDDPDEDWNKKFANGYYDPLSSPNSTTTSGTHNHINGSASNQTFKACWPTPPHYISHRSPPGSQWDTACDWTTAGAKSKKKKKRHPPSGPVPPVTSTYLTTASQPTPPPSVILTDLAIAPTNNSQLQRPQVEIYQWQYNRDCDQSAKLETRPKNLIGPLYNPTRDPLRNSYFITAKHMNKQFKNYKGNQIAQLLAEYQILTSIIEAAVIRWHKPIQVNLYFQVKKGTADKDNEPSFALLDTCIALHKRKGLAHRSWLKSNAFMLDLRSFSSGDRMTKAWPMLTCLLDEETCKNGLCDHGKRTQPYCLRKAVENVNNLWLCGSNSSMTVDNVWRAIRTFPNLNTLGFDFRTDDARDTSNEGQWLEFEAPKYFIKSLHDMLRRYPSFLRVGFIENLHVRIAAENKAAAFQALQPGSLTSFSNRICSGRVAETSREWNYHVVAYTVDEMDEVVAHEQERYPNGTINHEGPINHSFHAVGGDF